MPKTNQSGISYGQKKQEGQTDTQQLIEIASYLRKKYKVKVKREPYLIFDIEGKILPGIFDSLTEDNIRCPSIIKNPDLLWIDKYGMWIIEVDGAVHDRKVEKTEKRNRLYLSNHIKLIVVNLAEIKFLKINIYKYIDKRIAELIQKSGAIYL